MSFFNRLLGIKEAENKAPGGLSGKQNHPLLQLSPKKLLHFSLVGDQLQDFDMLIETIHEHNIGENYFWIEAEGKHLGNGQIISLEVDLDPGIVLTLCGLRPMLRPHQIGLSLERLEHIDEIGQGSFEFEGQPYYYEDSDEVCVFQNQNPGDQQWYYYWDFISADQKKILTVERRGRNDYQVFISERLDEKQVQIIT